MIENQIYKSPSITNFVLRSFNIRLNKGTNYNADLKQGFDFKGQIINRVESIANFGHKYGEGFGNQATHPCPIFGGR